MLIRIKCGSGSLPEIVPRFGTESFLKLISSVTPEDKKHFSTSRLLTRDRSEIYNSRRKVYIRPINDLNREDRRRSAPIVSPSQQFSSAVRKALEQMYPEESLRLAEYYPAGLKLDRYMKSRNLNLEGVKLRRKEALIKRILDEEFNFGDTATDIDEQEKRSQDYNKRREKLEKIHLDRWVPLEFDKVCSFAYLLARSSAEYAVLETILKEVQRQEPDFNPKTFFDFGSGIGTGFWATSSVFGRFSEIFCVDKSTHMNDLARSIITQGVDNGPLPNGLSFRLHFPSSTSLKYDLVLSAYTMMEVSSANQRLEIINSLWARTEEEGCLILVELGTNAGFQIISEARDYLLQIGGEDQNKVDIVAPCPHTVACPRYFRDDVPCNFSVRYKPFEIKFFENPRIHNESYTYVVMKKGRRSKLPLPRLVEEPLKAKNNFYCRLCTQDGSLQEIRCNKKFHKPLYNFSKFLHWGDEMPVALEYPEEDKESRSQDRANIHCDAKS